MLALLGLVHWMIAVMPDATPERRRFHLSPDRLIVGLLAAEGFLLLSEQFQWFAFNERKGWTVLIAVGAVGVAVVVMLLWLGLSLLFRWRFQFSVRSLVVLVVAVAMPCCWLAVKLRAAERQRRAVEAWEAMREAKGWVMYDYEFDESGVYAGRKTEPPALAWLRELLGVDFFADVVGVHSVYATELGDVGLEHFKELTELRHLMLFRDTQVTDVGVEHLKSLTKLEMLSLQATQLTDAGLEQLKGLTKLEWLDLSRTRVTDAGLVHLKGLTRLERLDLSDTQVTEEGIEKLRKALPNCDAYNPSLKDVEGGIADIEGAIIIPPLPPPTPKTNLDQN